MIVVIIWPGGVSETDVANNEHQRYAQEHYGNAIRHGGGFHDIDGVPRVTCNEELLDSHDEVAKEVEHVWNDDIAISSAGKQAGSDIDDWDQCDEYDH